VPQVVERSGALLHAFFPGTEGGRAIADVLFGDYNPGGKEPVTWPRSVGQLPIHHYDPPNGRPDIPERGDYKAHYLDESNAPLFAFGFGLSYSTFKLEDLALPQRLGRDDTLSVKVRITNTSEVDGDEVPQLYVRPRVASSVTGKKLVAYRRVHLAAHESQLVELAVPASALSIMGPDDRWRLESGTYEVLFGTSSRDGLAGSFELADAARVAAAATTPP
jgi:beta-glucosidase